MKDKVGTCNSYEENIKKAIFELKERNYALTKKYLREAILENNHGPEVYNLLGILAELMGDLSLAGKHYRASYAFDPTYKPASRNLERITSFYYRDDNIKPDYGDKLEEEESTPYFIQYDDKNIGHLRRRE